VPCLQSMHQMVVPSIFSSQLHMYRTLLSFVTPCLQKTHGVAYLAASPSSARVLALRCVATVNGWLSKGRSQAPARPRKCKSGHGVPRGPEDRLRGNSERKAMNHSNSFGGSGVSVVAEEIWVSQRGLVILVLIVT